MCEQNFLTRPACFAHTTEDSSSVKPLQHIPRSELRFIESADPGTELDADFGFLPS